MKAIATTYKPGWLTLAVVAAGLLVAAATLVLMAQSAQAAFPGTNGKIAFVSNVPDADEPIAGETTDDKEIYVMNRDGTGVVQLTHNEFYLSDEEDDPSTPEVETVEVNIDDLDPAFSPNGKKIAFTSNMPAPGVAAAAEEEEEEESTDREVYIMRSDGTGLVQVTDTNHNTIDNPALADENEPAFSPEGKKLVYRVGAGKMAEIWIYNLETKNSRMLIEADKCVSEPVFSPDGTKVAYRYGSGINADLYLYNLKTKVSRPLVTSAEAEASPNWAPGGKKLVFAQGDESAGAGLAVYSFRTGKVTVLTDPDGVLIGQEDPDPLTSYSDRKPAFSPNGKQIVFESSREWPTAPHEEEPAEALLPAEHDGGGMPPEEEHEDLPELLYKMKAEPGANAVLLSAEPAEGQLFGDSTPDWQPVR